MTIRSFVLRQGRITAGQERAFAEHWPRYGLDVSDALRVDAAALYGDARERAVGDVVAQDGDGVVADEAQVVEACGRGGEQRMADAGAVDFDADIARVRRGLCHLYEAFAVAKADFEVEVAVVAK